MRVVLDTNIVVSALLWGGTPQPLLAAASEGQIEIYTSEPLLLELAEVLPRPEFAERIHKAQRTVSQLLEQYRGQSHLARLIAAAANTALSSGHTIYSRIRHDDVGTETLFA